MTERGAEPGSGHPDPAGSRESGLSVHPQAQRRRWSQWPLVLVLAGMSAGLAVVASNHFRRGTVLFALSVLGAAVLRAALPERTAGLLVVRSRTLDTLTLGVLAVGLVVLALVVPPPP